MTHSSQAAKVVPVPVALMALDFGRVIINSESEICPL